MLNVIYQKWRKALGAKKNLNRGGFTLIEILMVLMILSIGVLPVAVIQHRGRQEVTESDRYTEGIMVASSQLERTKGMGFGNAVADSGSLGQVEWSVQVTNVSFGLDRISVTSSWLNSGQVESLTVTDLVSMR
ncbi:MAG: prepilin-type N-terminal cleavage/methylation domain-containing protein [Candidatus Krumholzibacteriia bacterium]|jgi:prepilin-type N-terminal cleavage/methylation domain-containing protein